MSMDSSEPQKPSNTENDPIIMAPSEKKCTYCDSSMPIHARVCCKCSRDQRRYLNYFRIGDLLLLISLLISFGMVYFSYRNFHESREERIKASEALTQATAAKDLVAMTKRRLDQEVKRFGSLIKQAEIKLIKVEDVVNDLNKRSKLMKLADKAIAKDDADSYRELLKYETTNIGLEATSENMRVKSLYLAGSLLSPESLSVTTSDGSKKVDADIPTSTLVEVLKKDKSFESRAKAARLLGSRSQSGVPEVLLEVCKKDKSLEVTKSALQSFATITGYRTDVLECTYAEEWWSKNRIEYGKRLKPINSK